MEINKNEDIIAYIKFYHEIKKVILTPTFDEFKIKLCKVLQIDSNLFNTLKLNYNDEDGDTIIVSSDEDYNIFLGQIKNKEVDILNIEKDENANIDINACSNSIIKFHEKINNEENEKEEEIKNNKNNLDIISNQHFEINNEKNKNIQNNKIIQDNQILINNNEHFKQNQNNIIIENDNDDNLVSPYIQKDNINNDLNRNNNINRNYINNSNNINNINNINNLNNEKNNINLNNQIYMVFPYNCNLCNQYPIIKVLYYCLVCGIPLCQECEEKLGINHRHSILKIQTKEQFDDLNTKINRNLNKKEKDDNNINEDKSNQSNIQKFANNIKDIKDSVLGALFGKNKKDENINNNFEKRIDNNQQMIPQKMNLIQLARAQYDLNGISDTQLQEAIEKSNGNIDDAIVLLMP